MKTEQKLLVLIGVALGGGLLIAYLLSHNAPLPPVYRPAQQGVFSKDTVGCPTTDALADIYSSIAAGKEALVTASLMLRLNCRFIKAGDSWRIDEHGSRDTRAVIIDAARGNFQTLYVRTATVQ